MKQKMKKRKQARLMAQKGTMVVRVMMAMMVFTKSKDSEISLEQGEVVVVDKVFYALLTLRWLVNYKLFRLSHG
jgi:hypothetical protein